MIILKLEMAAHTKLLLLAFTLTLMICFLLTDLTTPSSGFEEGSEEAVVMNSVLPNPVNQVRISGMMEEVVRRNDVEMLMDYEKDPGANNKHLPPSTNVPPGVGG
ncbi:hypothetical protein LINPERPRIM_LOCUS24336 [Linum perenne]